ncbi:MAG: glycosyltransferase family 2 protein [Planctomycetes bacterium]|nr:glycosyltransferase family 2 protein [Planctomycetota bacterium]
MTTLDAAAATAPARDEARPGSPAIAVVVLTWNSRADTLGCLQRIAPQLTQADLLVVADNGSEDGTEAAVRAAHPEAIVVQNGENLGFAGGVNAGLRVALSRGATWCLVLNADTEPPADFLACLRLAAAAAPPQVAALQPLLVAADDPDRIDSAGLAPRALPGAHDRFAGEPARAVAGSPRPIFGACGAAALLRSAALAEVGLYDDELFVLFEDVDLAFRLRSRGHEALLLPDLLLPHRRGVSAAAGRKASVARARRRTWVQRNTIALALRHWPLHRVLLGLPVLAVRAIEALFLARTHAPKTCLPLWRRALAERSALRAGLRRAGADAWLGRDR